MQKINGNGTLRNKVEPWRIFVFAGLVGVVFIIYIIRLFTLQVVQGPQWTGQAEENRIKDINTPAQRGIILDRNEYILARNIPSYNVVIIPSELPDDAGAIQEIFRQLSKRIDVPVYGGELTPENPYVACLSDHGIAQIYEFGESFSPFEPVRVTCDIDKMLAMAIKEKAVDWPGVDIEVESVRDYPTGSLTAAVVGFLGPISAVEEDYFTDLGFVSNRDKVGYAGAERYFQSVLGGRNGLRVVEVDVGGQVLLDIEPPIPPEPGNNLKLTIDTRLQSAAEAILIKEMEFWNTYLNTIRSTSGVIIAINPRTGEILAMVSYPTYENNRMARFIPGYYYEQLSEDPANPLMNHAVGDELNAGSVFKLVTAVGALNEGVVTPDQIIKAPPSITIEEQFAENIVGRSREFIDWNDAGFGELDFTSCIANSSNVCFYKVVGGYQDEIPEGLGICRLGTYARALGYGDYPAIELPLVEDGLIPDPTWKRLNQGENWSTGDTYIAGVGQGFVVATPIQVLMSAAVIANDGVMMRPTILREVQDGEGNVIQPFQPEELWDLTEDPLIDDFSDPTGRGGCENKLTGNKKTVDPWVIAAVQEGMRMAVLEGTLEQEFEDVTIAAAGKTGTAEYCDKYALEKGLCEYGRWPTHSWTVAYAPFDEPEIAVVAFVYNGGEGAAVAGPIVRQTLEAYFNIRTGDTVAANP